MFRDIVSNLSLSPAAGTHLAYYWRRLQRERLTRQLAMAMGAMLVVVQLATIIAPPDAASAGSSNDVIYGGISSRANLMQIYDQDHDSLGHGGYHQLFAHFGIDRNDLANTVHSTINSNDHSLWSVGRNPHSTQDQVFTAGGSTRYYLRPLYTWGDNISYGVLSGHRHGDGAWFAVMDQCGNIVVKVATPPTVVHSTPQPVTTTPTPVTKTPAPPTPTPAPVVTPAPTPKAVTPAPVPGQPNITVSKSAMDMPAGGGPSHDANGTTAAAGDVIEYTLTTANTGTADKVDYTVSDNINDILEYANLVDPRGAILMNGTLTWPAATIKAGGNYITTFQVQVKNPVPTTPTSTSDPQSFDLKMQNVYGNLISINLPAPLPKQVEATSAALPQTGAGTDMLIVLVLVGGITYFYFRNRQLVTEIGMLRNDHHGGGRE